ncbi:MAG: DUF1015 domain-containing protein [Phycisphaerae bacterium]|nr:DUF1015 domain-containing protein [Phycisphaerae bacterium]
MSTIRPFPAIRYATITGGRDISTRLAPPYDVLDQSGKDALLRSDPLNFVRIDLPHMPPNSAGPPAAYESSNNTLRKWLSDGTMVRDQQPALYIYHQTYRHGSTEYVRKMFFARLRLEPFGQGSIFPHERTFGGPKEDRLALTKATQANLSPIFGLYEDADNQVARRLEAALSPEPLAVGTMDEVENRLWAVTDQAAIAEVAQLLEPKPTYIADGHHRCGTAMLYRDGLIEREGPLPEEHPANFVLCVFCAMEDPGLLILPTHRVLSGVRITADTFEADEQLELSKLETSDPDEAVRALGQLGPLAVGWHEPAAGGYYAVRPKSPDILDVLEPEHSESWCRLGLAFLHAYLLERVVAPQFCGGQAPVIQYAKSGPGAVEAARETNGTAFLMQPTTMEELRGVCGVGDLMPHKSTYFYPKLASGLVINPLASAATESRGL